MRRTQTLVVPLRKINIRKMKAKHSKYGTVLRKQKSPLLEVIFFPENSTTFTAEQSTYVSISGATTVLGYHS